MSDEKKTEQKLLWKYEEFMTEEEIAKVKRKRGSYSPKKKISNLTIDKYTEMKNLYEKLAGFMPIPLFSKKTEVFCCSKVRIWHYVYNRGKYTYQDIEYEGDDFKVVEAEIIGTENLYIDYRIEIHKELIHLLSDGVELEKALENIKPMIQKAKGAI